MLIGTAAAADVICGERRQRVGRPAGDARSGRRRDRAGDARATRGAPARRLARARDPLRGRRSSTARRRSACSRSMRCERPIRCLVPLAGGILRARGPDGATRYGRSRPRNPESAIAARRPRAHDVRSAEHASPDRWRRRCGRTSGTRCSAPRSLATCGCRRARATACPVAALRPVVARAPWRTRPLAERAARAPGRRPAGGGLGAHENR